MSEGLDEQAAADKIMEIFARGGLGDEAVPLNKTLDEMCKALETAFQVSEGGYVGLSQMSLALTPKDLQEVRLLRKPRRERLEKKPLLMVMQHRQQNYAKQACNS